MENKNDICVRFIAPTHWRTRAKWVMLEDYQSQNENVTVVKGFVTDGATIPWLFRMIFSPTGRYFGAAIIHDYCIDILHDWDLANRELNAEMKALGIRKWRRLLIMGAVRFYKKIKEIF